MLLMVEKGIRRGICHYVCEYTKANNKYKKVYDKIKNRHIFNIEWIEIYLNLIKTQ